MVSLEFAILRHYIFFVPSQVFSNKRELIMHSERAVCKSVPCDNCGQRFANSSTLRQHFCLLKTENMDADFEGIVEVIINNDTPWFQVCCQSNVMYYKAKQHNAYILSDTQDI